MIPSPPLLLLFACLISLGSTAQVSPDFDTVRQRLTDDLLAQPVETGYVKGLVEQQQPDGHWPDLDYRDTSRTGFQHGIHLARLVDLARAYRRPGTPLTGDTSLKQTVDRGLDLWLAHDYRSANWWWNEIGVPDRMVGLLLLLDEDLTPEQRAAAAPIAGRANLEAWGARPGGDLIKIAGILGRYGLYARDTAIVHRALAAMTGEIQLAVDRGTPDDLRGLQTDLSFQHRHDRVTSVLSYGLGYAAAFADWAERLAGTRYQFPDSALHLLVDFYLDGIAASSAHGIYPDPGAKNRGLSRPGALRPYSPDLPRQLRHATDYRAAELDALIDARQTLTAGRRAHNRYFYNSSYLSHQRPQYFTSVRMYSNRNHSVEVPYNSEGLKNHYLADGANWLTRDGDEYLDIFPVLDYRKIPGTTVVQRPGLPDPDRIQQRGLTDFAGGVSDGTFGAAALDLRSPLDSLRARKGWFLFDEAYVALGAGITSGEDAPVATTLDQRWLDGAVIVHQNGHSRNLPAGTHDLKGVDWILHDGTGYLFPAPSAVRLRIDTASGSWYGINRQSDSPREPVTDSVFQLWIDHGTRPQSATYAYTVIPATDTTLMGTFTFRPTPRVLVNSQKLQAVEQPALGITQAAFYAAGHLSLSEDLTLTLPQPGLVMVETRQRRPTRLTVADPTHQLATLSVKLDGQRTTETPGVTAEYDPGANTTILKVTLPTGERAGGSVVVNLTP